MCASRQLLIFINILFLLASLAIIGVGSYGYMESDKVIEQAQLMRLLPLKSVCIGVIVVGCVLLTFACCGALAAIRRSKGLLMAYSFIVFLVCAGEITAGVLILRADGTGTLDRYIKSEWEKESNNDRVLAYQQEFDCCGWPGVDAPVPNRPTCDTSLPNCRAETLHWIKTKFLPVAIVLLVIAGLQFVALFASCALLCTLKSNKNDYNRDNFY